jgi:hypothetical protein
VYATPSTSDAISSPTRNSKRPAGASGPRIRRDELEQAPEQLEPVLDLAA